MFGFHRELGIVSMQHRSEHTGEWTVAVSVNILNSFLRTAALLVDLEYVQLHFYLNKLFHSMHGDGVTQVDKMMHTVEAA